MKSHRITSQERSSGWLSSHQRKCSSIHLISDPPSACWKELKANSPWWIELYEQQLLWSAFLDGFLLHASQTYLKSQFWISFWKGGIRSTVLTRGSRTRHDASERGARNQEGVWFSLARREVFVQQIYTSISPTELLSYYKRVKQVLWNTSFVSDFCSRHSGMSEFMLVFMRMGMAWCSSDHMRQASSTTIDHFHVRSSHLWKKYQWLGVVRPCSFPMQVPHATWSQLGPAHTCDAGLKPRAKELRHSTMFYTHQGNDLQFISASWLLCKLLTVRNFKQFQEKDLSSSYL